MLCLLLQLLGAILLLLLVLLILILHRGRGLGLLLRLLLRLGRRLLRLVRLALGLSLLLVCLLLLLEHGELLRMTLLQLLLLLRRDARCGAELKDVLASLVDGADGIHDQRWQRALSCRRGLALLEGAHQTRRRLRADCRPHGRRMHVGQRVVQNAQDAVLRRVELVGLRHVIFLQHRQALRLERRDLEVLVVHGEEVGHLGRAHRYLFAVRRVGQHAQQHPVAAAAQVAALRRHGLVGEQLQALGVESARIVLLLALHVQCLHGGVLLERHGHAANRERFAGVGDALIESHAAHIARRGGRIGWNTAPLGQRQILLVVAFEDLDALEIVGMTLEAEVVLHEESVRRLVLVEGQNRALRGSRRGGHPLRLSLPDAQSDGVADGAHLRVQVHLHEGRGSLVALIGDALHDSIGGVGLEQQAGQEGAAEGARLHIRLLHAILAHELVQLEGRHGAEEEGRTQTDKHTRWRAVSTVQDDSLQSGSSGSGKLPARATHRW